MARRKPETPEQRADRRAALFELAPELAERERGQKGEQLARHLVVTQGRYPIVRVEP